MACFGGTFDCHVFYSCFGGWSSTRCLRCLVMRCFALVFLCYLIVLVAVWVRWGSCVVYYLCCVVYEWCLGAYCFGGWVVAGVMG